MSITSSVLVGNAGRTIWMKVQGRGTFQNGPSLKEFALQMIQRGHRDFVVDLGACELMDSTFMGMLASIALRLKEIGQGTLRAVRVNARNFDLLSNLGLDYLFEVENDSAPAAPATLTVPDEVPTSADEQTKSVLAAHEALVAADANNAVKFQDVIEYLRQEIAETDRTAD